MLIQRWGNRWGIPPEAIAELILEMRGLDPAVAPRKVATEQDVGALVRVEMSKLGGRLWRNNVGAAHGLNGHFIRYGLANETAEMNAQLKSSDYIGLRPVEITGGMVGLTIGQFVARETKAPGWSFRGTEREIAQEKFISLVNALGGDAAFASGEGSFNAR